MILVLSPWHPYLYGYLITEPELHKGFFQVENWLREYCAQNNVPLYGSYDPECIDGLEETDFLMACTAPGPALHGSSPAYRGHCSSWRRAPCPTRWPCTRAPAWKARAGCCGDPER